VAFCHSLLIRVLDDKEIITSHGAAQKESETKHCADKGVPRQAGFQKGVMAREGALVCNRWCNGEMCLPSCTISMPPWVLQTEHSWSSHWCRRNSTAHSTGRKLYIGAENQETRGWHGLCARNPYGTARSQQNAAKEEFAMTSMWNLVQRLSHPPLSHRTSEGDGWPRSEARVNTFASPEKVHIE
jgi:hypothetical protein